MDAHVVSEGWVMLKRNLTAATLIAVSLFFILYLRTLFTELTDILFFAFMAVGAFEMYDVGRKAGYKPMFLPIIAYLIAVYPLFYFFSAEGILFAVLIASLMALSSYLFRRQNYESADLEYSLFILIYPLLLCSVFFLINHADGNLLGLFLVLFITLLSDAFALFSGLLFGKKKLMEDVSPKKTVAGAVGAYVGGLLGGVTVFLLFDLFAVFKNWRNVGLLALSDKLYVSIPLYVFLSFVGTTLAIIGDLVASWLKRKFRIKDFGKIFPGHGGVMDRLDSLLFVAPFICLFFVVFNEVTPL